MSSAFPGTGLASTTKPAGAVVAPTQGHGSATAPKAAAFGSAGTTSKPTGSVLGPLSTNTQPLPSSSSSSQSTRVGKFPKGGVGKDAGGASGLNPKAAAPKLATEEPTFESYEMSDREDSSSDSETDEEKEKARKKKVRERVEGGKERIGELGRVGYGGLLP